MIKIIPILSEIRIVKSNNITPEIVYDLFYDKLEESNHHNHYGEILRKLFSKFNIDIVSRQGITNGEEYFFLKDEDEIKNDLSKLSSNYLIVLYQDLLKIK